MARFERSIDLTSRRLGVGGVPGGVLDGSIVVLLFTLIALPVPSLVAGDVFATDFFYHWDHFAIAQALAHRHGMALSLEVYAPYGLGWPTLSSVLSTILPLSHQNAIASAALVGGAYFSVIYLLLRFVVSRRDVALAGTLLALWLDFFSPLFMQTPGLHSNWQWPSMVFLRAPFDGLFFLCLFVHARTRRPLGSITAAGCMGLGLLFETDTGWMLVGTFAVYWTVLTLFGPLARADGGNALAGAAVDDRIGRTLILSLSVFALVMAIGFSLATHGRFLSEPIAVLASWQGGLTNAVHASARLFKDFVAETPAGLLLAFGTLGVCLFAVGDTACKALHRRLDPLSLWLGCLGFHGAGRLVLFAWNSEPIRSRFAGVSAAIILSVAFLRALAFLEERARASRVRGLAIAVGATAFVALVASAALVLSSPTFAGYPNVWNRLGAQEPGEPIFLLPQRREIRIDEDLDRTTGRALRAAIDEVRALTLAGERVAVLDPLKTFVYLESGAKPWRGDAALFMNTWTRDASRKLVLDFRETGPRYVLMRRAAPRSALIRDTWIELRESLHPRYHVERSLPLFDLLLCETCGDRS